MVASTVEQHTNDALISLQAAETALQQGQPEVSGRHLLHSLMDALKAVASSRGLNLRSEANVWNYAEALATGWTNPPAFSAVYPVARFLFVDSSGYGFTLEQLHSHMEYIAPGVRELLDLARGGVSS